MQISGLCAAVQDGSVLVQRSALDLLMVCFPMTNKQLLYADMVRLVTASLTTILRRDMSLNRRLYSWLLSADANTPPLQQSKEDKTEEVAEGQSVAYDLLNEAIRVILNQSAMETPLDIKPYRLLTSLFDKPQIGPIILDSVLCDVFRALYLSCLHQQKQKNSSVRCVSFTGDLTSLKEEDVVLCKDYLTRNCQELVKNANLLFNTLQSYYIWSYIEKLYKEAAKNIADYKKVIRDRRQVNDIGSGPPTVIEICILTDFLLDIIPVESYVSGTSDILPNLFNQIISTLKQHIDVLNKYEIVQSLQLSSKILSKIQPISLIPVIKQVIETASIEEKSEADNVETPLIDISDLGKESRGLEKSKSDSKINENLNKNELTIDDSSRERSNSNQMFKKKEKTSPRIEKKVKNKKSKSSSKLYDIKNQEPNISESVIQESLVQFQKEPPKTMKIENKFFVKCLEEYKEFYVSFIRSKLVPDVNISEYFKTFIIDKGEETRKLEQLLDSCLRNTPITIEPIFNHRMKLNDLCCMGKDEETEYDSAMTVASDVLLEFTTFPNLLNDEVKCAHLPYWLETLIVCACSPKTSCSIQMIAMNTLLEIFSLAKSQELEKDAVEGTKVIQMGILERAYVTYIEDCTTVIKVSPSCFGAKFSCFHY